MYTSVHLISEWFPNREPTASQNNILGKIQLSGVICLLGPIMVVWVTAYLQEQ